MRYHNNHKCKCNRSLKWTTTNTNHETTKRYYYCPSCLLSKEYCKCDPMEINIKTFIQENFFDRLEPEQQ